MTYAGSSTAERQRLAELDRLRILDTPAEAFSDSVAAAAACMANVPIAALSFIDRDRQWVKSACGLVGNSIPRAASVCSHVILGNAPLVVADLSADERFLDNPSVAGAPHLRFYAGFPIVVRGESVGVLCVVDDRTRTLSPTQLADLQALADHVAVWAEMRAERP